MLRSRLAGFHSGAFAVLALVAVATPLTAHAQLNAGDILLNNLGGIGTGGNVQRYSAAGALIRTYTGSGTFYEGAAVTPTGSVVTTYKYNNAVANIPGVDIFNAATGVQSGTFTLSPFSDTPGDVSVFADGILAVNDQFGPVVRLFSQSGSFVRTISTAAMTHPFGSTVSPLDNTLWVTDITAFSIFHFSETGTLLGSFAPGFDAGDLVVSPTDGTLWVSGRSSDNIVHMSTAGATLGSFSTALSGRFDGIGITSDGANLYATTESSTVINRFNTAGTLTGSINIVSPNTPVFLTVVPGAAATTGAPEPGTLALVLPALAALGGGFVLQRRHRPSRRIPTRFVAALLCGGGPLVLAAQPARAQNLLLNPGFESPVVNTVQGYLPGQFIGSGWLVTAAERDVVLVRGNYAGSGTTFNPPSEGAQFLYLGDSTSVSTIEQSVSLTAANYRLQFDLADFAVQFSTPGGQVILDILGPSSASVIGGPRTFTTPNFAPFATQTTFFSAATPGAYRVQLTSIRSHAANLDNFNLVTVAATGAPEPSTLALVLPAFAVLGVGVARRRAAAS